MKLLKSLLITVATLGFIFSCASDSKGTTVEDLKKKNLVKIGFANEAPYAYRDPETGELTGEAPEIAKHVFAELGIENVEGVVVEWGSLIPALKAGRYDVIAAGMYITPERAQQVYFTDPSYAIGEGFAVKAGNPKDLHSYEDVKANPDVKLGVVSGTVEVGYAEKVGIPDEQVVTFGDNASAISGVKSGRVDAFAGTSLTVQDLVSKVEDGSLEVAKDFVDPVIDGKGVKGYGAFAFRPEDKELRKAFNEALNAFIGTEEHQKLVNPFGFGEAQLPGGVTAEELVQ